ncbi:Uncharacterised protein [Mycobacterium tuberculosis]|nr:Uncharacterised protein [Mycobacterium tuberculosis]
MWADTSSAAAGNNLVVAAAAAFVEALIDDPMLAKSPAAELSMSGTAIM